MAVASGQVSAAYRAGEECVAGKQQRMLLNIEADAALGVARRLENGAGDAGEGVDFDLFLEKWNGRVWSTVATSDSPNPDEKIDYTGAPGYYRYRVVSASGSGPYKLGYKTP